MGAETATAVQQKQDTQLGPKTKEYVALLEDYKKNLTLVVGYQSLDLMQSAVKLQKAQERVDSIQPHHFLADREGAARDLADAKKQLDGMVKFLSAYKHPSQVFDGKVSLGDLKEEAFQTGVTLNNLKEGKSGSNPRQIEKNLTTADLEKLKKANASLKWATEMMAQGHTRVSPLGVGPELQGVIEIALLAYGAGKVVRALGAAAEGAAALFKGGIDAGSIATAMNAYTGATLTVDAAQGLTNLLFMSTATAVVASEALKRTSLPSSSGGAATLPNPYHQFASQIGPTGVVTEAIKLQRKLQEDHPVRIFARSASPTNIHPLPPRTITAPDRVAPFTTPITPPRVDTTLVHPITPNVAAPMTTPIESFGGTTLSGAPLANPLPTTLTTPIVAPPMPTVMMRKRDTASTNAADRAKDMGDVIHEEFVGKGFPVRGITVNDIRAAVAGAIAVATGSSIDEAKSIGEQARALGSAGEAVRRLIKGKSISNKDIEALDGKGLLDEATVERINKLKKGERPAAIKQALSELADDVAGFADDLASRLKPGGKRVQLGEKIIGDIASNTARISEDIAVKYLKRINVVNTRNVLMLVVPAIVGAAAAYEWDKTQIEAETAIIIKDGYAKIKKDEETEPMAAAEALEQHLNEADNAGTIDVNTKTNLGVIEGVRVSGQADADNTAIRNKAIQDAQLAREQAEQTDEAMRKRAQGSAGSGTQRNVDPFSGVGKSGGPGRSQPASPGPTNSNPADPFGNVGKSKK